jgi:hypothetical protein
MKDSLDSQTLSLLTEQLVAIPSLSDDLAMLDQCIDFIINYFASSQTSLCKKFVINGKPSLLVSNFS